MRKTCRARPSGVLCCLLALLFACYGVGAYEAVGLLALNSLSPTSAVDFWDYKHMPPEQDFFGHLVLRVNNSDLIVVDVVGLERWLSPYQHMLLFQ